MLNQAINALCRILLNKDRNETKVLVYADSAHFVLQSPTNKSISTALLKQVLSRRRWQVSIGRFIYYAQMNVSGAK